MTNTIHLPSAICHLSSVICKYIYPSVITRTPVAEKKIFLTFDDGPIPEVTPRVLSILEKYEAKATFFCVGKNIEKHSDIFRQIISEGHWVGNHTYDHLNGWNIRTKKYLENIKQCDSIIKSQISNSKSQVLREQPILPAVSWNLGPVPLFRPPYGKLKPSQYSIINNHYSIVMWDVLSRDFDSTISKEKCLYNVLTKTRIGSIVVFHDSFKAAEKLFYVLPRMLEYFTEKEFSFASIQ